MFILLLAIFVFILTVRGNLFFWLLALFVLSLIFFFTKKQKYILFTLVTAMLALSATARKQYRYLDDFPPTKTQPIIYHTKSTPQGQYYIGTWKILDKQSQWKYIFEDNYSRRYFLSTKKKFQQWDEIQLEAYFQIWYTGTVPLYDIEQQKDDFLTFFDKKSAQKYQISTGLSSMLHYEFDFPKRLMMKWYYGTLREQNSSKILWSNKNMQFLQKARKKLQEKVIKFYGRNRTSWLILWMLIGDKSEIPPEDYNIFIKSSLVHIIAVSGWNIVMIVVFLSFVLFFLPFYVRNTVILVTIISYSFLCGLDSSVFRAMLMWGMWLVALFRWRELNIRRVMAFAFVTMLLINPFYLVYDVGFILSFSAIVGLIRFDKIRKKYFQTPKELNNKILSLTQKWWRLFIKNYIRPTIGATTWVLPILMFFMWQTNILWIVANMLILPIVPFVMIYWLVSVLLYQLLHRERILFIEEILVHYIYRISEIFATHGIFLEMSWQSVKYELLILSIILFALIRLTPKTNP